MFFTQAYYRRFGWVIAVSMIAVTGCVKSDSIKESPPFEHQELDACLAYLVDQSGSFAGVWEQGGYDLFLKISDQFFIESMGNETKLVIAQLGGASAGKVVLFEGRPQDIRRRFPSPQALKDFIRDNADFGGSNVYESTRAVTDYVTAMPDVTENTKLMTVIFSDMIDTASDQAERNSEGRRMLTSLSKYRELGGALAVYFAAPDETSRWRRICGEAGFENGRFVIESRLVENHLLPSFE